MSSRQPPLVMKKPQRASIPPSFSRLPPDGDEFPSAYQEDAILTNGSCSYEIESKVDDTDSEMETLPPPPPLPCSNPPKPKFPERNNSGAVTAAASTTLENNNNNKQSSSASYTPPMRRFQRQDEKSEKSVRDKIAMFSSVTDTAVPTPRNLGRHQSSEDISRVITQSRLSRASTQDDVRTEQFYNLSLSSSTRSIPPIPDSDSNSQQPLPEQSAGTFTLPRTNKPSYDQTDNANWTSTAARNGYNSPFSDRLNPANRRYSTDSFLTKRQETNLRQTSLESLLEQRCKSVSKLRRLVIPEKGDVVEEVPANVVAGLPKIVSRDSVLSSNGLMKALPATTVRNGSKDVTDAAPSIDATWKLQDVSANNMPKYSPAFKRKPFAVYKTQVPSEQTAQVDPSPKTPNNNNNVNGVTLFPMEPKSLESITSPHSDASFEFSSTPPSLEDSTSSRLIKPIKCRRTDDSDNDSALSSSRSSDAHGLSPSVSPTPSSESRRVLKAQSVEAINRKNVLQSAKSRSGNMSQQIMDTEDDSSSPESLCFETEERAYSTHDSSNTEDDERDSLPPLFSSDNPVEAIHAMECHVAYMTEVCDDYMARSNTHPAIRQNGGDSPKHSGIISKEETSEIRCSKIEMEIDVLERTVAEVTATDKEVHEDRWAELQRKYAKDVQPKIEAMLASSQKPDLLSKSKSVDLTPPTPTPASIPAPAPAPKPVTVSVERKKAQNFKALAEKWQQLSEDAPATTAASPAAPAAPAAAPLPPPKLLAQSEDHNLKKDNEVTRQRQRHQVPPPEVVNVERKSVAGTPEKEQVNSEQHTALNRVSSTVGSRRGLPDMDSGSQKKCFIDPTKRTSSVQDIRKAFDRVEPSKPSHVNGRSSSSGQSSLPPHTNNSSSSSSSRHNNAHARMSSQDSTASDDSSISAPTHAHYGSFNSLGSGSRDAFGSVTSLASTTSLITPQELQQLVEEANQTLEDSQVVLVVTLHRTSSVSSGSIGITLAGGADQETKEITVHKVIPGSLAGKDGRVLKGDRVLSINGKSMKGVSHKEALQLLKAQRPEVVLVLSRNREQGGEACSSLDSLKSAVRNGEEGVEARTCKSADKGPEQVVLHKAGGGLGFSLEGGKDSPLGDRPLTIKKIFMGGLAEKSGLLQVGIEIISINAVDMAPMSRIEAWNFMKKLPDGDVVLAIKRVNQ